MSIEIKREEIAAVAEEFDTILDIVMKTMMTSLEDEKQFTTQEYLTGALGLHLSFTIQIINTYMHTFKKESTVEQFQEFMNTLANISKEIEGEAIKYLIAEAESPIVAKFDINKCQH